MMSLSKVARYRELIFIWDQIDPTQKDKEIIRSIRKKLSVMTRRQEAWLRIFLKSRFPKADI